jgi:ubiquinone/menaquinone biosynthesis C-methylase UbiE
LTEIWALGDYEQIAQRFGPIHDRLVAALAPAAGERWLDLATGTGEVALRAARAGAQVTALDLSEPLLEQARLKAAAEELPVDFVFGDVQSLPFGDAAFDVVSSTFGLVFAPDRDAVAHELARVMRPGGRLGLTAWRRRDGQAALYERFRPDDEPPPPDHTDWGREELVDQLLGDAFELELDEGLWYLEEDSPAALFELMTAAAPPTIALLRRLDPERRDAYRKAQIEYWEQFIDADGRVREPWRYLFVRGTRR